MKATEPGNSRAHPVRIGTTAAIAAGVAAVLMTLPGTAAAVHLDYTVDVGVERNDNVALSETDPIEEDILRSGLGFALTHDTSIIQTSMVGRAEYRNYLGDAFSDTVDGSLEGRFNWFAVPERLSFTVEDRLAMQPVDALAANSPGNRQQVNVLSLGPNLYFDLGNTLRGQAELRFTDSDAEVTDEFNSQRLGMAVRTVKELSPSSQVSLNLQGQRVNFDDDVVVRDYNRYDVFGRYAHETANFNTGLDVGFSRLSYRDNGGSRSDPLVRAHLDWVPNARHHLSLAGSQQFSDAATDALTGIGEDAVAVPHRLLMGDTVVNASPYRERRLSLGYAYVGTRLGFAIEPYVDKLDYVDSDEFDQDGYGATLSVGWQIQPRLSIGGYASIDNIDYVRRGIEHETRRYGIQLQREWSRHWSGRIELERQQRRSSVAGDDADQTVIYLGIVYRR